MNINLREAAWLRANGNTWEQIAAKLKCSAWDVEKLVIHRTVEWQKAFSEFSEIVEREAECSAMKRLDSLSNQDDNKSRFNAASVILRHRSKMEDLRSRAATNQVKLKLETLKNQTKLGLKPIEMDELDDEPETPTTPVIPPLPLPVLPRSTREERRKTLTSFLSPNS
jgi:hypothetical protein